MPQLQILQYTTAYLVSADTQKMAEANELINKMINKMYQNINSRIIFSITIYRKILHKVKLTYTVRSWHVIYQDMSKENL